MLEESKSLQDALASEQWDAAMHSDYDALLHNQMWHLVPPHNYQNIVDCE
jgi:hypothetical protein